jgi:hypothetical protein
MNRLKSNNSSRPSSPALSIPDNDTNIMQKLSPKQMNRNRVHVACRFRPQISYEMEKGGESCIEFDQNDTVIVRVIF